MKKHLGKLVAFLLGVIGVLFLFLRGIFDPKSLKHEAAKIDVEKHEADVVEKKADVAAAEADAAKAHESIDARLTRIDEQAKKDAARDSVSVANDIIKGA